MITKDYCSYEVAKLLKEKGFDECIFEFYEGNRIKYARNGEGFRLSELGSDIYYPHITHQMAMKWLREVHKIIITIDYNDDSDCEDNERYGFSVYYTSRKVDLATYVTYEEAVEAALKYCLKNLI